MLIKRTSHKKSVSTKNSEVLQFYYKTNVAVPGAGGGRAINAPVFTGFRRNCRTHDLYLFFSQLKVLNDKHY